MNQPTPNISRWLKKQHVVSWCVSQHDQIWCSNAFYVYDPERVMFYILTDPNSRHGQMTGAQARIAGSVNGQPKTVARIRGVQFQGTIQPLSAAEAEQPLKLYLRRFPVARAMPALPPVWAICIDEMKFTDNTLGFGQKFVWQRQE